MCGLFAFYNYGNKPIQNLPVLTNSLAKESAIRGTHATGIAYMDKDNLHIYKAGKSAYSMEFKHPDNISALIGHTRHATQGDAKKNYNNHPFKGSCNNKSFCLAHNGVLFNDDELRNKYNLKKTKIETDSFIAVQMLEHEKKFDAKHLKSVLNKLEGSFAFSLLDSDNALWLIKGDNPISLIHLKNLKLYVYASTDEILYKSLVNTTLFNEIKSGDFEEISINSGDILNIHPDGKIVYDRFEYVDYSFFKNSRWWAYDIYANNMYQNDIYEDDFYINDLKAVARTFGYDSDVVDELINEGFTLEEIEEFIYCTE